MARRPNNLPIFIAVAAAIGGVVVLNVMQQKNDPDLQEHIQEQDQKKAQEDAAKKTDTERQKTPAQSAANELVTWEPDKMMGKAGGSPVITIGYVWTPDIQGDPSQIYDVVQGVISTIPNAAVRVVDLDAKPGAVPAGIRAGNLLDVPLGSAGEFPPGKVVSEALHSALEKQKAAAKPK